LTPPHNLLVVGDLLFVGWYQDGVRVFKYDVSNPDQPTVTPIAYQAVRPTLDVRSQVGVWGVRVQACTVQGQPQQCLYASDISPGLIILALETK
jgi:hypothetical protein